MLGLDNAMIIVLTWKAKFQSSSPGYGKNFPLKILTEEPILELN